MCQVSLKLAQQFWRRILNFVNVYLIFRNNPLIKDGALHLNKLMSWSPKDAWCQAWLKLVQWFWRRFFFLFRQCIFAILLLSPLGKRIGPFIWTHLNPFYLRMHCLIEIEIKLNPAVLEKNILKFCQCIFSISLLSPLVKR